MIDDGEEDYGVKFPEYPENWIEIATVLLIIIGIGLEFLAS